MARSYDSPGITRKWWRRLLWLVAIWLAGVLILGVLAYGMRCLMSVAGMTADPAEPTVSMSDPTATPAIWHLQSTS